MIKKSPQKACFTEAFVREKNERVQYIAGYLKHAQDPQCPQQTAWVTMLITHL